MGLKWPRKGELISGQPLIFMRKFIKQWGDLKKFEINFQLFYEVMLPILTHYSPICILELLGVTLNTL